MVLKLFYNKCKFMQIEFQAIRCLASDAPNGKPPWKVLFFGSDDFSLETLKTLNKARLDGNTISQLEVISSKATDKLNPVKKYTLKNELVLHTWPHAVSNDHYDVGVVASFGYLIPNHVVSAFPWGIINVHPSLLPRWRGAAPINHTILNGDKVTGVSIMKIEPYKFDVGKILLRKEVPIPDNTPAKILSVQLAKLGADMLLQCLSDLPMYLKNAASQNDAEATKAPKLKLEMAAIDWTSVTDRIYRQFLALDGWLKLHTYWMDNMLKFDCMIPPKEMEEYQIDALAKNLPKVPGQTYIHKKRNILCIRCQDGWVGVQKITIRGSRTMSAKDFYNGFLSKIDVEKQRFSSTVQTITTAEEFQGR